MRLAVVEDNQELAQLLAQGLKAEGYATDLLTTAAETRAALTTTRYAGLILDLGLPDGDGLSILREIRLRKDPLPVLVLTARGGVADRVTGLRDGADDYLVKPFALAELLARMRAVLRRSGRVVSGCIEFRDVVIDELQRSVTRGGQPVSLTSVEFELLVTLARAPGRVFSKPELLSFVWGFDEYDPNLVEVHVSSLRRKIGGDGATLIQTERGRGYVLRP